MNLLLEIYDRLLINESVDVNSITDSIKNLFQVVINYEGDPEHGVAPGLRTIQPYVYGTTKAGNPVIRAYQPYGDTASEVPDWKFFRIDRIKSWKPTFAVTKSPAPKFNPEGDKSMGVVYTIADFNQEPNSENISGPKQTFKPVGKIDNIDKVLADREKDKQTRQQQAKISTSPRVPSSNTNIPEPQVNGVVQSQQSPAPEVSGVVDKPEETNFSTQDQPSQDNTFKTKGDEELAKIKDLNSRMDNARKIDLSKIPRR